MRRDNEYLTSSGDGIAESPLSVYSEVIGRGGATGSGAGLSKVDRSSMFRLCCRCSFAMTTHFLWVVLFFKILLELDSLKKVP